MLLEVNERLQLWLGSSLKNEILNETMVIRDDIAYAIDNGN